MPLSITELLCLHVDVVKVPRAARAWKAQLPKALALLHSPKFWSHLGIFWHWDSWAGSDQGSKSQPNIYWKVRLRNLGTKVINPNLKKENGSSLFIPHCPPQSPAPKRRALRVHWRLPKWIGDLLPYSAQRTPPRCGWGVKAARNHQMTLLK